MIRKNFISAENRVDAAIDVIKLCIKNNTSINRTEQYDGFVKKVLISKNTKNAKNYKKLLEIYDQYLMSKNNAKKVVNKTIHKTDVDKEDKYDNRSTWVANRDSNNTIIDYSFTIYIQGEKPFIGKLTREQVETIHQYYPHVTMMNVSSYFPYLTFQQFKRVLRCFNITKDTLFPLHILEEHTEEEIAEFALKNKASASLNKIVEKRASFIEKKYFESQEKIHDLKDIQKFIEETIKEYFTDNKEQKILIKKNEKTNEKGLFIYLSDMHIGASNDDSQYSNIYNTEIIYERLSKILNYLSQQKNIYGKFESLFIVNLGDMLDGYNSETTRTGHILPQNLGNKDQFKTYLDIMLWFFNSIINLNLTNNLNYYSIGDDNHSGDFGYIANLSLKYIFELKYPHINFNLFNKYIEHFFYGDHAFIASHGKDKKQMKNNLPSHLDQKTDLFFVNYIKINNIKNKSVIVVKGDLHQYNTEIGKNFRYTNIPSIYGGSPWTDLNYGYTQPGFVFQIIEKNNPCIIEGYLNLD